MSISTSSHSPHIMPDGLDKPRRYWAWAAVIVGITLAVIDGAVANVALPTISQEMGASPASTVWVVNAYQLVVVMLLLPLASIGEIYGYKKIYFAGLIIFTLASVTCALSTTLPMLIVSRLVQGSGAAAIMSVNTALLRYIFPQNKLGRAIGINALVVAVASTIGPTLAGLILAVASWHWLFAINIPIGILSIMLARNTLPDSETVKRSFDLVGALLAATTFGLFIMIIDGIGNHTSLSWLAAQAVVVCIAAFFLIRRELARPAPLLPLDLLRIPVFALSIGTSIASFSAQMLAFVSLPFLFQTVFGFSATHVGLLMTPWTLAVAVSAPIAGRLADRHHSGLLGGIGLVLLASGLVALAFLPAHPTAIDIVWRMIMCGVGFGLFQSPNNRTMIAASPRSRSGAASGMLGTARLLGQSTGTALVVVIVNMNASNHTGGLNMCLIVGALFAFTGAVISLSRLHGKVKTPHLGMASDLPSVPAPNPDAATKEAEQKSAMQDF